MFPGGFYPCGTLDNSATIRAMKIAILSDIHGNLPALEAVAADIERWQPDVVLVNGDSVNRGPDSPGCWQFVQQRGWAHTRGNHEEYMIERLDANYPQDKRYVPLFWMSSWTFRQFNGEVAALQSLPEGVSRFAPDGSECRLRHASMRGNTDNVTAVSPFDTIRAQIAPPPAVFATAHTHHPFVRVVDQTIVVNSGSVGSPSDGDVRPSYARIHWQDGVWSAEIARVPYDREQALDAFRHSGFMEGAGPMAWLVYHEWRAAEIFVTPWRQQYEAAVLDGQIDMETAVAEFLRAYHL